MYYTYSAVSTVSNAMSNSSQRTSAKQRLIDVASAIVASQGVHELTIEGVAAAAGVTKGGLIYHFKTKDELLGAVVQSLIDEWDRRSRTKATQAGNTAGDLIRAMSDDTFDMPTEERQLISSLLAAASSYPHLLGPVRDLYGRLYGDFSQSGPQSGIALVIAAALDGLSMLELLDFHQFPESQREAIRHALHTLARKIP